MTQTQTDTGAATARGRILVADDDEHIAGLIALYLAQKGYAVTTAEDGDAADRLLREMPFDLAILDIMMPGLDGLEVIRALRRRSDLPVIFVSARGSDIDKVAGLHLGADDYVTKPFSPSELVARVETVLRRSGRAVQGAQAPAMQVGDLVLDTASHTAMLAGEALALTPKEFDLLAILCRFVGVALARDKLLDLVWGSSFYGVRTVDIHVLRLRRKLRASNVRIETVWGSGYRLEEGRDAKT
jgi:DNA-binding response OmpR family regulator